MRIILITLLGLFFLNQLAAQDVVILKSGREFKAKVLEITPYEIKYKRFSNLDGPMISMDKSDIFMVKYQNGEKEVFEGEKKKALSRKKTSNKKSRNSETNPVTEEKEEKFFIYGGLAYPEVENIPFYKQGFVVGLEYEVKYGETFSVLTSVSFTQNPYEENFTTFNRIWGYQEQKINGSMINYWSMAGLKAATTDLIDNVELYGVGSLGFNGIYFHGDLSNLKGGTFHFSYGAGAGIIIGDTVQLGIRYASAKQEVNTGYEKIKHRGSVLQVIGGFQF